MVSWGFTSREFASRSPFAIKFANPSDTMSACAPPFSIQGFPTFVGHISSYCCAKNFDIVKMNFLPFCLEELLLIYLPLLTAFSITFLTHLKKKGHHSLFCLRKSLLFRLLGTCSLYRSDLFNSLPISLTEWPENRKNRCLSSRALKNKQCRPSFSWSSGENKRKRQKKKKKRTKIENLQNGPEKFGGKKLEYSHI